MALKHGDADVAVRADDSHSVPVHSRTSTWHSIRLRMMLPIVVAAVGILFLGVARTVDAVTASGQAQRASELAAATGQIVTLAHRLGQEYLQSTYALRQKSLWSILDDDMAATDGDLPGARAAIETIRGHAPELGAVCDDAIDALAALAQVREAAPNETDGSELLLRSYDTMTRSLLALADAVPAQLSDPGLVQLAQSLALIGQLDRLAALQLDVIARALNEHAVRPADAQQLSEWIGEERTRVDTLHNLTPAGQMYAEAMGVSAISDANSIRQVIIDSRDSSAVALTADGAVWMNLQTARIDGLTALRTTFTERLIADADALGRDARTNTLVAALVSGLIVVGAVATATVLVAGISRRLRRTRRAALAAARVELPTAIANVGAAHDESSVRAALNTSSARIDAMLTSGPDEVGELAAAFGAVYRQALRLAADQALLRMEIQAMFTALSRRGQTLVQRQIHLIDEFGRTEADPDALARLFALDHLAARMRRNEENLLVLAGGEPGRWITRPVSAVDLLRAAAQEIEEYRRVQIVQAPDVALSAQVAGDVIHLLAELMENATTFSSHSSAVRVFATRERDGMTVRVEDSGIGMPVDRLEDANRRLAQPSALTSHLVSTMGLLVVARLAERHQIQVWLSSLPMGGTAATVVLPEHLLVPTGRMPMPPVNGIAPVSGPPARPGPPSPSGVSRWTTSTSPAGSTWPPPAPAARGRLGPVSGWPAWPVGSTIRRRPTTGDSDMQGHLPIAGRGTGAPF